MSAYTNANNLFDDTNLANISTYPEWNDPAIEDHRQLIGELWEKRSSIIEEGLDRRQTGYYWTSYVLRRIGYCFSVSERTPAEGEDVRPDFTLFKDAGDFLNARAYRGGRDFFAQAIGVVRSLGWDESLDQLEEVAEGENANPAFELDRYMRLTNLSWGIMTNGHTWRIYNRDSSGLLNTYFEMNLMDALKSDDEAAFKHFWMIFGPHALGGNGIATRLYD